MNWLTKSLDDINKDLQNLEHIKALDIKEAELRRREDIYTPGSKLSQSTVWSLTKKEHDTCKDMSAKLMGYRAQHGVQRSVLQYLQVGFFQTIKYKIINANSSDIDTYINASKYWKKRSTMLERENKRNVTWVFAENKQMQAIICNYRDNFIVCSMSSHENIMREVEGKEMLHPLQWDQPQPPDAVDQILELL